MAEQQDEPDFIEGIALDSIPDGGLLAGWIGDRKALLIREGDIVRAIGGSCSHLGAPLAEGLVAAGEIRCPWHHACFDIATGRARKAPAFDPLPTWPVSVEAGRVRVTTREPNTPTVPAVVAAAGPFVVIGGGAAGYAAALALKTAAPDAVCTLVSDDEHAPYDRTLLTKDYLDGKFGEDRLPISQQDLAALGVDVRLSTPVTRIDRSAQRVVLASGEMLPYAKLLVATGAEPKRPDIPGIGKDHVTSTAKPRGLPAGPGPDRIGPPRRHPGQQLHRARDRRILGQPGCRGHGDLARARPFGEAVRIRSRCRGPGDPSAERHDVRVRPRDLGHRGWGGSLERRIAARRRPRDRRCRGHATDDPRRRRWPRRRRRGHGRPLSHDQ